MNSDYDRHPDIWWKKTVFAALECKFGMDTEDLLRKKAACQMASHFCSAELCRTPVLWITQKYEQPTRDRGGTCEHTPSWSGGGLCPITVRCRAALDLPSSAMLQLTCISYLTWMTPPGTRCPVQFPPRLVLVLSLGLHYSYLIHFFPKNMFLYS